ncbi:gamma-aminobutyric acid type B receptor subunit 2-like isoform X2 [Antennarius striatus]|uniref:gamma-aminobutyric acid type B receptor subunit 2-like isoform X2 n=1 Tax=Antennarius striatus TaxID=241820 RepID=UPI0035B27CAD
MGRGGRAETLRLLLCWLLAGPALPQDGHLVPAPLQARHPVPVLWMRPGGPGSGGVDRAVRLALEDLQKQPAPLGGYQIQLHPLDCQCDPAESLKALFDAMWAGPKYLLVFGGVCPSVTALIGRALPSLHLVQVSFAAPAPSLANRKGFGSVFSTAPSERAVNRAAVTLLQRYGWSRVGVVTQDSARASEVGRDLEQQLLRAGVQVVTSEELSGRACSGLRRMKEQDVRVIIGRFQEEYVSDVFCCAYRLNLFGPRYQWIVADGGVSGWRLGWRASGCSTSSLLMAAGGAIRLQVRPLSSAAAGASGRTPQDAYLRLMALQGSKVSHLNAFAYDAIWVAASALSQVMEAVTRSERLRPQGGVGQVEVQRMLLDALKKTRFEGASGLVYFRNGERMTSIDLIQLQDSGGVLVGQFHTWTQQLRLKPRLLRFKGAGPARDRPQVVVERGPVSVLLYGAVSSASALTIIIIIIITLTRPLSSRRHKPRLQAGGAAPQDRLLLLGLLLCCSSVPASGLDGVVASSRTLEVLCSVQLWTLWLGHSLVFTALFTNAWAEFSEPRPNQEGRCRVRFWMVLLDVFVLACWQILDPPRWAGQQDGQGVAADPGVTVLLHAARCSGGDPGLWVTALCGYKGPLLGLGCFVAWSIRPAPHRLTPAVWGMTAFSVVGVSASLLTSHNPPVHFCLTSGVVLTCTWFTLGWLFAPQCLNGGELQAGAHNAPDTDTPDAAEHLRALNQQLKRRTVQLDREIENISKQLCEPTGAGETPHNTDGDVRSETRVRADTKPDSLNSPDQ